MRIDDVQIKQREDTFDHFDYLICRNEQWNDYLELVCGDDMRCNSSGRDLCTVLSTSIDELLCMGNGTYCKIFFKSGNFLKVNMDELVEFTEAIWRPNIENEDKEPEDIINIIKKILCDGELELSYDQAYEVLLFCGMFAYSHSIPKDKDVQAFLKLLKLDKNIESIKIKSRVYYINQPYEELECCNGGNIEKLSLVEIINTLDMTVQVKLKDCPLKRNILPNGRLLAIAGNDKGFLTFLPRICCASAHNIIYQDGNKIIGKKIESKTVSTININNDSAVFFSRSCEYGIMIADKDGNWIITDRFSGEEVPTDSICFMRGDSSDYGYIYLNGTYKGLEARDGWNNKKIFKFDISFENGIALTLDRKAIDADGEVIWKNVADISCFGDRYIMLGMDGSVKIGEEAPIGLGKYHAVCADEKGYWAAADDGFYYRAFEGREFICVGDSILDEIDRDNDGTTVLGLSSNCEFIILH